MTIQQEDDEEDEDVLIYVATYTHIYIPNINQQKEENVKLVHVNSSCVRLKEQMYLHRNKHTVLCNCNLPI